jgi:hypothetical protein
MLVALVPAETGAMRRAQTPSRRATDSESIV